MNVALELSLQPYPSNEELQTELEADESFQRSLENICGLFIRIQGGRVYLLHQTVREFLVSNPTAQRSDHPRWGSSIAASDPHETMFRICASYLMFQDLSKGPITKVSKKHAVKKYCLPEYSAVNWAHHYRAIQHEARLEDFLRAVALCRTQEPPYRTWYKYDIYHTYGGVYRETDLTIAAKFGLDTVVAKLLNDGTDVDALGRRGTALYEAAVEFHENTMKLLLIRSANPDIRRKGCSTPLYDATTFAYTEGVKLLLKKGADVELGNGSESPLFGAVYRDMTIPSQRTSIIELLLENGAYVNAQHRTFHETILQRAVQRRNIDIVKVLLQAGADVNLYNLARETALFLAVYQGNRILVDMLVEKGAIISLENHNGMTALGKAQDVETLEYLIDRGVAAGLAHEAVGKAFSYAVSNSDADHWQDVVKWYLKKMHTDRSAP